MTSALPDYITLDEAATKIRRSSRWLKDAARKRRVTHVHIGQKYLFTEEALADLMDALTIPKIVQPDGLAATRERVVRRRARTAAAKKATQGRFAA